MKKVNDKNHLNRKKGFRISMAVHACIVLIALLPFLSMERAAEEDDWLAMEIEFVNSDISSGVSSEAPKVEKEEVKEKPVEKELDKPVEEPKPVSKPVVVDSEPSEVVIEENFDETAEEVELDNNEVVAEEEIVVEEVLETKAEEGLEDSDGDEGEGDEGEAITGKELGKMDFEGDGVFGRKVIYRADVKKITEREGSVVINLCIDRLGIVTHVAFNRDASTIDDPVYVRKAMDVASDYRFEKDYSAPNTQCGKLTFTFHIE